MKRCTCTLACIPQGKTEDQVCRESAEWDEYLDSRPAVDSCRHLRDALRQIADSAWAMNRLEPAPFGWAAIADVAERALSA